MKLYFAAAAAAASLIAPTFAHAEGYAQIQTGLDSVSVEGGSDEGLAYGVAIGYQAPISGNIFAGVEASVDDSTTKECISDADERACIKSGRDLSIVARLGTNISANDQLYVLGGYTNARIRATYEGGAVSVSDGMNLDGFRLGAGYSHTFTNNIFAKVEYRYSNYEYDFSRHNALVAVGVKF